MPEEKLEFLKREEIRTMQKDIAALREKEAQRERERVAALKPKVKKEIKKKILSEVPIKKPIEILPKEKEAPVKEKEVPVKKKEIPVKEKKDLKRAFLIPKLPKRPSVSKKILVRGVVVLFFLSFVGFLGWLILSKKISISELFQPILKEEVVPPSEEIEEEKPSIQLPPSLIPVEKTKILEISRIEEIPTAFNVIMKEEIEEGTFSQVVIKNTNQNRLVSLEDLSIAFQIEVPEELFQKLEKDFTLFVYSQKDGKRAGIIAKIKEKEGIAELLNNWEIKISKEGISIFGQKIPSLASEFKTAHYQETAFRYLTISEEDLGVCYAFNNYLILTSSFESIEKVIEKIGAEKLEEKIGQLFIIGFDGKTLTPQLERFLKKYKPGGILLLSKNIENKEQLKTLISDLQDLSLNETGLPLFIAVDQEGEPISRIGFLEEKTSQSQIENTEIAFQVGQKRGEELKELGVNLNLAPLLDAMEEEDFYFDRTFQKSASQVGELSKALILGQKKAGILTAIKHFPGYVGISFNPESKLAILEKIPEISQFKDVMSAEPEFVIASNVVYEETDSSLPFVFSPQGIELLKSNLGSEILIISDDLSQTSLLENFSLREIITKPIEVGVDILIFSGFTLPVEQGLDIFLEAVENGEVPETRINEAILRIVQLKQKLLE